MLSVIIQAGGESRRMGQDKALMLFLGQPLIWRIIQRVSPLADEVLVITNHPEDYAFLGLPLFSDLIPGRGALGGLYTALKIARHPLAAVVACDMPFVSLELLKLEKDLLDQSALAAAIPATSQGIEPFHAVYRRSACLPAVEKVLEAGKWRVNSWMEEQNIYYLYHPEVQEKIGLDEEAFLRSFWNLNTPEDFAKAESILSE